MEYGEYDPKKDIKANRIINSESAETHEKLKAEVNPTLQAFNDRIQYLHDIIRKLKAKLWSTKGSVAILKRLIKTDDHEKEKEAVAMLQEEILAYEAEVKDLENEFLAKNKMPGIEKEDFKN